MKPDTAYILAVGLALTAAFLIIRMDLAAGFIGNPDHIVNTGACF
jgi:hypothetical protein